MSLDQSLNQYRELKGRVDTLFREIQARHPTSFACKLGCHSCCKSGLTVNALEREEISRFLAGRPELVAELRELERANPHRGKRCSFLDAAGACGIYEARPLVCRSHGAPLQFRSPEAKAKDDNPLRLRDACPLNFKEADLGALPAADVINLDTLNTLLALLAQRALPGDDSRTPLTLSAFTK